MVPRVFSVLETEWHHGTGPQTTEPEAAHAVTDYSVTTVEANSASFGTILC